MTGIHGQEQSLKRLAQINLTTGTIEIVEVPKRLRDRYLGGRGLNMALFYEMMDEKGIVDPFDLENPLIFGTGLLTGTGAPSSSRMNITTISPESKVFCDSNMGGFFPSNMRFSGFDVLIVTGRSPKPIYLLLENGNVYIRSAESLWEENTSYTQEELKKVHGSQVGIACIGPAGENLVRYACVISGLKNAAGRGGAGAVMGSKNLKAIVAKGDYGIPIAKPKEFFKLIQKLNEYLANSKIVKSLGKFGTPLLYDVSNMLGAIRTKNSQLNAFSDNLNASEFHKYVEKMISCSSCVVHCRHRHTIPIGDYPKGEGPEYSTVGLLGANIGIDDPAQVIALNNLVNELGLDVSSTGSIISWVIELFEKGQITEDQIGRPLEFGNFELIKDLIISISERSNFGDILAEGRHLVRRFANITDDLLIAIKGLPQSDPHDCRYIKSFALGIATATRGADHLRSRPTLDIMTSIPDDKINEIYQTKIDRTLTSYQTKEYMVYFSENIFAVEDCLGLCRFICQGFNSPNLLGYEHFSELIKLATGLNYSPTELEQVGKEVINLERWINYQIFGIGFEGDTLPNRYFDDPMSVPDKPTTGEYID
ncbi:MAG: aldehyde ferredoxin oxidoreductase family protein, partial [Candidatus Hodarchaeales archaeon]